jgi:D-tyrosyl-tRNA(Tyr) deacylase
MEPEEAARLFECFCTACRELGVRVETGRFRAHMEVEIHNSGPVTLLIDSRRTF